MFQNTPQLTILVAVLRDYINNFVTRPKKLNKVVVTLIVMKPLVFQTISP